MSTNLLSISAQNLLENYNHTALGQMAVAQGVPKGKSRQSTAAVLARKLYDPDRIRRALEQLDANERLVLLRVIAAHGQIATSILRAQLEAEGVVAPRTSRYGIPQAGEAGKPNKPGSDRLEDIIARLGALGLVFSITPGSKRDQELGRPGRFLLIPDRIGRHLPAVTFQLEEEEPPAVELRSEAEAALRDLYLLVSFARARPIPLTSRGLIAKRSLVEIDEAFRLPEGTATVRTEEDLGRLPFLRALAEELGLVERSAAGLTLGEKAAAWFARSWGDRLLQLYQAYRNTARWSELARIPEVTMTPKPNLYHSHLAVARQRVLDEMAELPANRWLPITHLVRRIRIRDFEFLFSRQPASSHYYYDNPYYEHYEIEPYSGANLLGLNIGWYRSGVDAWNVVEGGFIWEMVIEALHWLGMVDLGGSSAEAGGIDSFRLTDLGTGLLAGRAPLSVVTPPRVVVQPNFQILAFEPVGDDVLFTLDGMAERIRVENVVEYKLTRQSVYAAQLQGSGTSDIISFLEQVGSSPLPQNVRRSIEEWGAQYERIVAHRGVSLLEAIDAATLDTLYADARAAKLLGRRVSPTAALLPRQNLEAVTALLVSGGPNGKTSYPLPALSEGDDTHLSSVVTIDREGRITPRQRVPSMNVMYNLRRFAGEEPDGTLRLTPASLRRGVRAGLTPDGIIEALDRYGSGPMPSEVPELIRRFARDWGRGALVDVLILQVENEVIMAELLADPDLQPYLSPIPHAPALATIPRQHASRVRDLLEERGMDLGTVLMGH